MTQVGREDVDDAFAARGFEDLGGSWAARAVAAARRPAGPTSTS